MVKKAFKTAFILNNKKNKKNNFLVYLPILSAMFFFAASPDIVDVSLVPVSLVRPSRDKVVKYPVDAEIGELGQGDADADAYLFARLVLNDVQKKTGNSPRLEIVSDDAKKQLFEKIDLVVPRKYRLGGAQLIMDTTSFLFRYIGRENELAGALYLIKRDSGWEIDDILPEEVMPLSKGEDINTYEWTPYAAFY